LAEIAFTRLRLLPRQPKLYQWTGNCQQACEHLATATSMYGEMEMRFYLERA
jgi:hypothetical protein